MILRSRDGRRQVRDAELGKAGQKALLLTKHPLTGKLIGMQYFDAIAPALSAARGGVSQFATFLSALLSAQDDAAETERSEDGCRITQRSWTLMAGVDDDHPACARFLHGLFEGLAAGCGRHIGVDLATAGGRAPFVWTIA